MAERRVLSCVGANEGEKKGGGASSGAVSGSRAADEAEVLSERPRADQNSPSVLKYAGLVITENMYMYVHVIMLCLRHSYVEKMNFFILGKIQARERAGQLWAPYQRHQEDHPITRERNEGAQRPHELGTRKNIIELERNGGRENVLSEVCIYACYHLFLFVCFSRWRTKCSWSSARRSA